MTMRDLDSRIAGEGSGHDWGWVGSWGIIIGVHRCVKCGQLASEENVRDGDCLAALSSTKGGRG